MIVTLKDFEVLACHGVNPEEKVEKQRFLITAVLDTEFDGKDDINSTVSYSSVKKLVKAYVEEHVFDLIETLADGLANGIIKAFPLAKSVEVEVKKPDAPMSGNFDYVSVRKSLAWHKAYLALGSNMGDRNAYLDYAVAQLNADDNIRHIRESERICSKPYGDVATEEFVNSALECETIYTPHKLLERINKIEAEGGRVRLEHWGNRTLDIDILFYDNDVIGDCDLCIPHPDMQNRTFVLQPLASLNENIYHPVLHKRIRDMLFDLTTCKK